MKENNGHRPKRSTFVNVVSWFFIVISGFWTFLIFIQNMMVQVAFPQKQVAQAMKNAEQTNQLPFGVRFLISNLDFVLFALLLLTFALFVTSVGLLRRRKWARYVFIVFLLVGVFGILTGMVFQFAMFNSISRMPEKEVPNDFNNMMLLMRVASVMIFLFISSLFGFIIKKLCSKEIRHEFSSGRIAINTKNRFTVE